MKTFDLSLTLITGALAGLGAASLVRLTYPLLLRHALAQPNARSSHEIPTPQGAGLAVIAATLAAAGAASAWVDASEHLFDLYAATFLIAAVGLADDIRSIPVGPRLALQSLAVSIIVFSHSSGVTALPFWIERGIILLAGVWVVNLVNFMDGLDWMTVVEAIPVTSAVVILGLDQCISMQSAIVAAALCGAMIGFAPFNRPVAKVFLGDVGSLPIGLLMVWFLLELINHHLFAAAFLLPLYYFSDATITLLRRIVAGERFWIAHRSHFYQRATSNGYTVLRVVSEIFLLNLFLSALAIASVLLSSLTTSIAFSLTGIAGVTLQLYRFSRPSSLRSGRAHS